MFKVTVCTSTLPDTAEAAGDLIAQGMASQLSAQPQAIVLLNSGHEDDSTLLAALHDTWPDTPLIGSAAQAAGTDPRVSLLLLSSPDLRFHVSLGVRVPSSPTHAAEQALADVMRNDASVALCLTLPESLHEWSNTFSNFVHKLLPYGTPFLDELLPNAEMKAYAPSTRYYHGRKVLSEAVPIILACHQRDEDQSWRFTRQRGIVRKACGEHIYEYDTLIGDRRTGEQPRVA